MLEQVHLFFAYPPQHGRKATSPITPSPAPIKCRPFLPANNSTAHHADAQSPIMFNLNPADQHATFPILTAPAGFNDYIFIHHKMHSMTRYVIHSLSHSLVSMTTPCSFDGGVVNQKQPGPIHIEHCLAMWWEGNWGIIREEEKKRNEWCPSTRRYH